MTPEQARYFLRALALSELIGVGVFVGGAFLLPDERTVLLAIGIIYAVVAVGAFFYMRGYIYSRVKRPTDQV